MSKNKSFFQKLSDSLTSLFPFNSTTRENVTDVSFDNKLSPIRTSNRRVASVAFGKDEDESKIKRARLHYDLKSLPTSRIIKPNNTLQDKFNIYNNFNDTASELSETSNISVSTSGVSSLHPRSSKRLYLGNAEDISLNINSKYPRNLNVSQKIISPISNRSFKNAKEFISSPAKKILEKLDKLTTPITAADKLTSLLVKERVANSSKFPQSVAYSPYGRPIPPIAGKKPLPIKAVTISGSTNDNLQSNCGPIRSKYTKKMKRLGYVDDIDLDSESTNTNYDYAKLNVSNQLNFCNIPPLKKSISTNTEKNDFSNLLRSSSPDLEFTFRPPQTVNDEEYLSYNRENTVNYQFKSKVSEKERNDYQKRININLKSDKLWRCDTCFSENLEESLQCINCGNISKKNSSTLILPKKIRDDNSNVNDTLANKTSLTNNEENLKIKCNNISEFTTKEVILDVSKPTPIPVSINTAIPMSSVPSSTFHTKVEVSNINSTIPLEKNNASIESLNSKNFIFEQVSVSNESSLTPISSSTKPSSSEKPLESNSLPKQFSFGPSVDSTIVSSSTKILTLDKTSESNSLPKQFSFSQTVDSAAVSSSIKTLSCEKISESISTPKQFSFSVPVDSLSVSSSTKALSLDKTSESNSLQKQFTFGQAVDSASASSSTKPLSLDKTESNSLPKMFAFGQSVDTNVSSTTVSSSKPFSFGQASLENAKSGISTESTNQTFGQLPGADKSSLSSNHFDFNQSKGTEVKSTAAPFVFGKLSNTEAASSSIPTNKPLTFGIVSNAVEKSTTPIFNQTSNAVTTSTLSTTSPYIFGQVSSSSNITIPTSTFSLGQATSSGKTMFSGNPSFSFGQPSTTSTTSMFSTSSVTESPFTFGQKLNNEAASTAKPSPFPFGQKSNAEVNSAAAGNPKPALFGQTNSENGKSSSATASTFLFGQSSNTEQNSNISQPSTFSNPGSSLFGGSAGGTTGSLFGSNYGPQSSYQGAIFGSQTVTTTAPLATIEASKPPVASFSFSAQPASVFGAANSNTFSSSFSNTPQMNFSQPAVNQNPSQFPLPNNNNQSANMFAGSQSNAFQFGGSAQAGNSAPFGNSVANSFGGGLGEQTGFNFNSNQPGLFQFNSSGGSNSNLSTMSNSVTAQNPRRTLKSRRKFKN